MNYQESMEYMLEQLPMYQRVGKSAFKKNLDNIIALCDALGNPQNSFSSVHIAGTNGKGSSAHLMEYILGNAGYKTGMYTSPHLKSFTERIRVNSKNIDEQYVAEFVTSNKELMNKVRPSFFEITVAMAFKYFEHCEVDVAIIEVGLGGRLDSTNIITPIVSLITNISLDHTDMLGDTLELIAGEKAGIIKNDVPVVIGESLPETKPVFLKRASELNAPIIFADELSDIESAEGVQLRIREQEYRLPELADFQIRNIPGVVLVLEHMASSFTNLKDLDIGEQIVKFYKNGGVKGRWQTLYKHPLTICDTVHNIAGVKTIIKQLAALKCDKIWFVWGMVNDKDISNIMSLLPKNAEYIFCQANIPRAYEADKLYDMGRKYGLSGRPIRDVNDALAFAKKEAGKNDLIFVGGSTFVVAEINEL